MKHCSTWCPQHPLWQQQHGGDRQLQAGQHEDDLHQLHLHNTSCFPPWTKDGLQLFRVNFYIHHGWLKKWTLIRTMFFFYFLIWYTLDKKNSVLFVFFAIRDRTRSAQLCPSGSSVPKKRTGNIKVWYYCRGSVTYEQSLYLYFSVDIQLRIWIWFWIKQCTTTTMNVQYGVLPH